MFAAKLVGPGRSANAMTNVLVQKLALRDQLPDEERRILETVAVRVREVARDQDIARDGERVTESTLLLEGMAARCKMLSGGRRQISALHVAGDFVDLHSFLLKVMDHSVVAMSACTVAMVPHARRRCVRYFSTSWMLK